MILICLCLTIYEFVDGVEIMWIDFVELCSLTQSAREVRGRSLIRQPHLKYHRDWTPAETVGYMLDYEMLHENKAAVWMAQHVSNPRLR